MLSSSPAELSESLTTSEVSGAKDFKSKYLSKYSVSWLTSLLLFLSVTTLKIAIRTFGTRFFLLFLGPPDARLSPRSWMVIASTLYSFSTSSSSSSACGSSSVHAMFGGSTRCDRWLKSGFFISQPNDSACNRAVKYCCNLIARSMLFSISIASNAFVCSLQSLQMTTNRLSGLRDARPRLCTIPRTVSALSKRMTRLHTGTSSPSSKTLVLTSNLTSPDRNFLRISSCSPLQSIPSLPRP